MFRQRLSTLLLHFALFGVVALVGLPASANSVGPPSFDMIWSGTNGSGAGVGTNVLDAAVGDIVTVDLLLTAGSDNITIYAVGVEWTVGLVDPVWTHNLPSGPYDVVLWYGTVAGNQVPLIGEGATGSNQGQPASTTILVGQLTFQVADSATVAPSFSGGGGVTVGTLPGTDVTESVVLNGATLRVGEGPVIPEPSAALVFGAGLVVVSLAVRRR